MTNAIEVNNVTKIYRLYDKPSDRLREALSPSGKSLHKDFYALRDVSFHVGKGETLGIIGINGSGKSTVLKIITGVLTPSEGEVKTDGKISALLELGAGFNMEYTGIENVYMNGTMMGYSRKEMDARLPGILEFADIGDFAYQPVKSYSSGMFVRLAFALAINVDPEILIVDEALSVGDVFFQAKCYRRMEELRKSGTTILMVTHDMSSVLKYCDRTVILNRGRKVAEGKPGEMVDLYKRILAGRFDRPEEAAPVPGSAPGDGSSGPKTSAPGDGSSGQKTTASGNGSSGPAAGSSAGRTEPEEESSAQPAGTLREQMNVNPDVDPYGNGKAEIYDFGIIDAQGRVSSLVLKGETFTLRERIRFHAHVEAPIFTFTIRDKKGTDLTGTNTLFENTEVESAEDGDEYEVDFTQAMDLQGGEYLISMSCTGFEQGEHTVYHRMYDLINLTVLSNKNTVGIYDTNSKVKAVRKKKQP